MSEESIKKEMRQLIMLVSSVRSQDQDHWESHVEFSNQVIDFIKNFQKDINKNWDEINKKIVTLNRTVEDTLDSLLTGINPDSIKQTSQALKEIQETMGKSIQAMNLENIMRDLQDLTGQGIVISSGKKKSKRKRTTKITPGMSSSYNGKSESEENSETDEDLEGYTQEEIEMIKAYQEIYGEGHIPEHLKKKKKEDKSLLKPSDFFGL